MPRCLGLLVCAVVLVGGSTTVAQIENPVYVDDSPSAWNTFRRAQDQLHDNPAETVRLLQELLDESAFRLVPRTDAARDQYVTVRSRVLGLLQRHDALLERYRSMETAEAERQLRAGRLAELARTRPLTEPGLTAMLTLAQRQLERAAFHSALAYLRDALRHPDLRGEDEAHAWFMFGVASHYTGDAISREDAGDALRQLGARAELVLERLQGLINEGDRPRAPVGRSPLDRTDAVDLSDLVGEPIWSLELEDTLFRRRFADASTDRPLMARQLEEARESGYLMTTAPTIAGDVIYTNEGHTVNAYDRFSGSPVWPRAYVDRTSLTIIDHDDFRVQDMNAISVVDGRLVTLTGHAYTTSRSSDGRVICLDAETGRLQWSQRLDRLDVPEETSGIYPHSAPIIAEGKVFVLARRVSPQALASCYLFAFDLETGEPLWTRHLVSSGSLRRSNRAYGTLVERDGSLYLASPIGAVARIDAGTGRTLWLHRFAVPITPPTAEQQRRPWEATTPAVTPEHVVAITPGLRRIAVLDRETGDLVQSHEARDRETWNTPSYLLTDDAYVFAVGDGISTFQVDNYDAPVWTSEGVGHDEGARHSALRTQNLELRGRVQVAGDQLLVPVKDGLAIVESASGRLRQKIPFEKPGNPVATEAQLVVAGNDHLDVYMSLTRAEDMLRERIAARSDDPEPALSLMRLAIRAQNLNLTLESAHAAQDAIARSDSPRQAREAQDELFAMLVAIEPREFATTDDPDREQPHAELVEALFETLGEVVDGREQELAYLMAYGDWLAESRPERAIEVWQKILDQPDLRAIVRAHDGVYRTADRWVVQRMRTTMTAEHHALINRRAGERLQSLLADEAAELHEFLALGRRFPFAEHGLHATLHGVEQLAADDRVREARAALVESLVAWGVGRGDVHRPHAPTATRRQPRADSHAPKVESREAITALLGRYVQLMLDAGRTNEAIDVLRSSHAMFGELELTIERDDERARHSITNWLASLGQPKPGVQPLPRVGMPHERAEVLDGALVRTIPGAVSGAAEQRPPAYVLLSSDGTIECVDVDAMQVRWARELDAALDESSPDEPVGTFPEMGLVRADDRDVLLWVEPEGAPAYAMMLDADDGSERWRTPPIDAVLGRPEMSHDEDELREVREGEERLAVDDVVPRVHHDQLVLVAGDGRAAAFDLADGERAAWSLHTGLTHVHHAAVRDGAVVLVGVETEEGERFPISAPKLVVIDLATGTLLGDRPQQLPGGGRGVRWMRLGPFGRLLYATDSGLGAVEVYNRSLHWVNATATAGHADRWWSDDLRVAMRDAEGRLRLVELESAAISQPLRGPDRDADAPMPIETVVFDHDDVLVLYQQRLMRYDLDGTVIGSDIVLDERRYRELMRASDRLLVLSEMPPAADFGLRRDRGQANEHRYRVYQFTDDGMLIDAPAQLPPIPQRIERTKLLDDWLLLSTQHGTIAVHMPNETDADRE